MFDVDTSATVSLLNRLFGTIYRSLPVYLAEAHPWSTPTGQKAEELLARMAADHRMLAVRIAEAIRWQGGLVEFGEFPLEFTSLNDITVDFLLRKVYERILHQIRFLQRCVEDLSDSPSFQPLAEAALRLTLEHRAAIEEMMKDEG